MRWGSLSKRAFRGALAILVLNVVQLSICISACACVVFVWPHCLRALNGSGWVGQKNAIALNEKNSNEEPIDGVRPIHSALEDRCSPHIHMHLDQRLDHETH